MTRARDIAAAATALSVDGTVKLDGNYPVGTGNVALGDQALNGSLTGNYNSALGERAATSITSGERNIAIGYTSLNLTTTGVRNIAVGMSALEQNTSGNYNIGIGYQSLVSNTTASNNTAVGYTAGYSNTTGANNNFLGYQAGYANTTGSSNTAMGHNAFSTNTTGIGNTGFGLQALQKNATSNYNTAVGNQALQENQTGTENEAFGAFALDGNTTGNYNTAIGTSALTDNGIGGQNVAVGRRTLFRNTSSGYNVAVGVHAGYYATGEKNTFIGHDAGSASSFTGSRNTIIGRYNGNQGGLNITSSNNNIVLSDGDGNPRIYVSSSGCVSIGTVSTTSDTVSRFGGSSSLYSQKMVNAYGGGTAIYADNTNNQGWIYARFNTNGSQVGYISVGTSSTSYVTSSDYRLKENVVELTGATDRLKQLEPKRFNFIADADTTVDGFLAHEVQTVVPEAITGTHNEVDADGNPVYQGIDQSKLVPLLVATIKELEARITALENA